jgi:hypothetical protein
MFDPIELHELVIQYGKRFTGKGSLVHEPFSKAALSHGRNRTILLNLRNLLFISMNSFHFLNESAE